MSDLTENLDTVFDTTADSSVDPSVMADAASSLGTDTSADAAAPAASVPGDAQDTANTDTGLSPSEMTPTTPAVGDQGSVSPQAPPNVASTDAAESGGTLQLGSDGSTVEPYHPIDATRSWFNKLSPGAQAILAKGFEGGAAGVLAALAQREKMAEQEKLVNQARADVARKGEIQAIGAGAFKPKGGIIDAARGG